MKTKALWKMLDDRPSSAAGPGVPEREICVPDTQTLPAHNPEFITSTSPLHLIQPDPMEVFKEAHQAYLVLSEEEAVAGKALLEVSQRVEKGVAYCEKAMKGLAGPYREQWQQSLTEGEKLLKTLRSQKATLEASVNDLSARIERATSEMIEAEGKLLEAAGTGGEGFVCGRCYRVVTPAISYRHAIYCQKPDSEWPQEKLNVQDSGLEKRLVDVGKKLGFPEVDLGDVRIGAGKAEWESWARVNDWIAPEEVERALERIGK